MIVAVIAVRMVQVAVHDVVHVISVRNRGVSAARAMLVCFVVSAASVRRCASRWVLAANRKYVLLDGGSVLMVQVTIVQIIDVPFVPDACVPTSRTVHMRVALVMRRHVTHLLFEIDAPTPHSVRGHGPAHFVPDRRRVDLQVRKKYGFFHVVGQSAARREVA